MAIRLPSFVLSVLLGLVLLSLSLTLVSCDEPRRQSVIVIAVDSLPFHQSLCAVDPVTPNSGFQTLCAESVRFAHALTPSTLSVPALASVLTGLYPYQHGVRDNGGPALGPLYRTFAEEAVQQGLSTAFFSGGPPVWRRLGLHQGFEIFDDHFHLGPRLFRPFEKSISLFQSWVTQDVEDSPFAAVFYVPDLNFTDTVTENESGELRSLTYESQLDELDESLAELIRFLKREKRWDSTTLILTGLNGREIGPREGEIEPLLLNSENTQVTLLIKPARKARDAPLQWTVDRNVSLTDLGATLFELVGAKASGSGDSEVPVTSLISVLDSTSPAWAEPRPLLVESGWGAWHGLSPLRAALMEGDDLLLFEQSPILYNTLTDRLEMNPQRPKREDNRIKTKIQILEERGFRPWGGLDDSWLPLFRIPVLRWTNPAQTDRLLQDLTKIALGRNGNLRAKRWAAQFALEQKNWTVLAQLAKASDQPLWASLAERNLKSNLAPLGDPCLGLLDRKSPTSLELKACQDELFLALFDWIRADLEGENREPAKRRFQRLWDQSQQDLKVLKMNAALGLLWLPLSVEEQIPSRTQMALALPQLKRFNPKD